MQRDSGECNFLLVEDNPADLFLLREMLSSSARFPSAKIHSAVTLQEALEMLASVRIDVVLLDLSLPDSHGLETLVKMSEAVQQIPVIILTGFSDAQLATEALSRNAQDYLVKGEFDLNLLIKSIEYSIERKKAMLERIQLEKELSLRKQQLIEAVILAQERERRDIGQELHDNINQVLSAVKLSLSTVLENPSKAEDLVRKSYRNVSGVIDEIRVLSKKLILSKNLKEFGLVDAIQELIREMSDLVETDIVLHASSLREVTMSEDQKINIYRIIQEQLNNIVKYADASLISIRLETTNGEVHVSISDNGRGFDPSAAMNGVGLTNIHSRAELFNGAVTITSSPGKGCRLKVVMKNAVAKQHHAA